MDEQDFESATSTNFITPAYERKAAARFHALLHIIQEIQRHFKENFGEWRWHAGCNMEKSMAE
ncbi:hypothetical protein BACCAP_03664 [Pseudoflavonifractor capillosus ATCC 29799]|uniref:Uncharacterized protein n=1 Tax=Pseudoflavonifractor capillosus ATCC 29799 TaxID=411467 RepID=A6NZL3_9FIRM|nr:hypothetical protein BACCAP_03664 [Pseudoflavonifractor capillosus ATCC 29799]